MQWVKFSEVPRGSQFKFGGQLFRKLGMNLAGEPGGGRVVFPSSTQVELIGKRGGRVKSASPRLPDELRNRDAASGPET